MNSFNAGRMLRECGTEPLSESFLNPQTGFYEKTLPFHTAAWDRGFYFQVVLQEYEFQRIIAHSENKISLSFAAPHPPKVKPVRDLNGIVHEYPVFAFYIHVNRTLFRPYSESDDRTDWANNLTRRTKGIAHELLYAEQWAKYYDYRNRRLTQNIVVPHVRDEEILLCPNITIERLLRTHEKIFGVHLRTTREFLAHEPNNVVQSYFREWLQNFAVDRELCMERTCQYLATGFRGQSDIAIPTQLRVCMALHAMQTLTANQFAEIHKTNSVFYRTFVDNMRLQFRDLDEETIHFATHAYLQNCNTLQSA